MWRTKYPQRRGEGRAAYVDRIKRRLRVIYEKYGYKLIRNWVMARSVEPQTADPRDERRDVPNPPPCAPDGDTPSSTVEGRGEPMTTTGKPPEDRGVEDS